MRVPPACLAFPAPCWFGGAPRVGSPALAHHGAHTHTRAHWPSRAPLRQSNSSIHRRSTRRRPLRGRRSCRHYRRRRSRGDCGNTIHMVQTTPRSTCIGDLPSIVCGTVYMYVSPGPAESSRSVWLRRERGRPRRSRGEAVRRRTGTARILRTPPTRRAAARCRLDTWPRYTPLARHPPPPPPPSPRPPAARRDVRRV